MEDKATCMEKKPKEIGWSRGSHGWSWRSHGPHSLEGKFGTKFGSQLIACSRFVAQTNVEFDTTRGQTDELRSEGLRDEDHGHDDGAEAHELGSGIREEGADAQDLGGLHVSSGPITRAKARQIQQAVENSFAGFLGQEETNSNWSLKGLTQLTCLEMVNSPSKIRVDA
ncbi:hypothetical protein CDL15_Pgr013250 [Punica granatum]|uniref:Uncharacterized protein n=1 Tax=Punica granatum TaxID=22663 RepID=A0A218WNX8_PUNGR|nr:hypothetical protein CDL15_Pgr013250 [Punica granatum]